MKDLMEASVGGLKCAQVWLCEKHGRVLVINLFCFANVWIFVQLGFGPFWFTYHQLSMTQELPNLRLLCARAMKVV